MNPSVCGIIPARFASTRFPGKPLVDIRGKTMIQRVYEQASHASALSEVWVATDDERIFEHVKGFGGMVMMTSTDHKTGTDRCEEVLKALETQGKQFDVVINIQGDEPFIDPEQINTVAASFFNPEVQIATLRKAISSNDELFSPNIIKVVCNNNGNALYFSRSPIPYLRGHNEEEWCKENLFYKHIGIYAFRSAILHQVSALPPSVLERSESLEQLRWLEAGLTIKVETTLAESHSIDTPEDLHKV
jgi:3-deoxy-manno-octulosonate cytidylyltransferase (CMP-KDO synthetase)